MISDCTHIRQGLKFKINQSFFFAEFILHKYCGCKKKTPQSTMLAIIKKKKQTLEHIHIICKKTKLCYLQLPVGYSWIYMQHVESYMLYGSLT